MPYSVLIADDHQLIRQAWRAIISSHPDFYVVAECCNGIEVMELALMHKPDLILLDINMPGLSGIEVTKSIRTGLRGTKVIGVSAHTHPTYACKLFKEGAMAYVTKSSSKEELFTAMEEVLQNKRYLCEETKNLLADQVFGNDQQASTHALSKRESEIIHLVRQGQSAKEIAGQLLLTVKTVEVHFYNIRRKLNLKNTAAMINYVNNHFINRGEPAKSYLLHS